MNEQGPNMPDEVKEEEYDESIRWVNPKDGSVHIFPNPEAKRQFLEEQNQRENN